MAPDRVNPKTLETVTLADICRCCWNEIPVLKVLQVEEIADAAVEKFLGSPLRVLETKEDN